MVETSGGRIRVLQRGGAATPATNKVYATGLSRPFGIAFFPNGDNPQWLYVANADSVVRFAYRNGDLKAAGKPETIVGRLPGSYGHSTRRHRVHAGRQAHAGCRVGSAGNAGEGLGRPPEGIEAWSRERARRRPGGLRRTAPRCWPSIPMARTRSCSPPASATAWALRSSRASGTPWCSTNERDGRGDNLVPDYVTRIRGGRVLRPGRGSTSVPTRTRAHVGVRPDLKDKVTVPDVLLQAHSASLGLTFYTGSSFHPSIAVTALRPSTDRGIVPKRTGYKVVRIRLKDGVPTGEYEDFVTGFGIGDNEVWGRPVGITVARDGALLVSGRWQRHDLAH